MKTDELWQGVLTEMELSTSKANFNTWLKDTYIKNIKDNIVAVEVSNTFVKSWLDNKYKKTILKIIRNKNSSVKDIIFSIRKENSTKDPVVQNENNKLNMSLPIDQETGLNTKYTFDSFVVGPFNELAFAAATSVTKDLGNSMYNPLFIYGGVGIGKTHLIQAIGNEIKKNNNLKNIKYIQLEKFASGFINAIQNRTVDKFRAQFDNIDLLIIDDIQFLAGKEQTQEQFFNIFNDLYNQNKQIIISSDRHPQVIPTLEERLKSRLVGGTLADINYPDLETRIVIINKKLEAKNDFLSEDIVNYLANTINKNIRDLEGAVNRLLVYKKLNNNINLNFVKKIIEKNLAKHKKTTTFSNILRTVSEFYDLHESDLLTSSRKSEYVKVRQIIMYLLRSELKYSFPSIGDKLGGKDHTTVMYACNKIENELNNNEELKQEYNNILQKLYLCNNA